MQAHLLHLHQHYDATMVLITHDMDEALTLGHRILVMRGPPGRITGDLTPDLPKPAERTAPNFVAWKRRLSELLPE
jgi:ABC-type nitrate/sulfonate/bicarbonate transport system ATPase subunit